MTDKQVKELIPSSPFPIAGRLDISTGEETFTELSMHELLKNNVVEKSVRPVSIWSLVGPIGIGRTWTMAWLGRQARFYDMDQPEETWEATLIPGLGGGTDVRSIFESIFESTSHLQGRVKEHLDEENGYPVQRISDDAIDEYLRAGLTDRSTWAVLTGNRGRFPSIESTDENPRWTDRNTQLDFLTLWFKYLHESGIDKMVILLDEFEIVATSLSKGKLVDLSDGLRSFFDKIESNQSDVPDIQLILSLTTQGATNVDPAVGPDEVAGWVRPLQERMSPPHLFEKISEDDALSIARNVIDVNRVEDLEDPYKPYTEEAIIKAFEASNGLPREFAKILNQMHQHAYTDTQIDISDAEDAIEILSLSTPMT